MDANFNGTRKWVIENAKSQIRHYQNLIERTEDEIKKSEWMNGNDPMKFKVGISNLTFLIKCNQTSWRGLKEKEVASERPFYLSMGLGVDLESAGFTIEQAKQLRDYLNQKIDYLESPDGRTLHEDMES